MLHRMYLRKESTFDTAAFGQIGFDLIRDFTIRDSPRLSKQPDLGVIVCEDSTWSTHIAQVSGGGNRLLYNFKKMFSIFTAKLATVLFKAYVRPVVIEYLLLQCLVPTVSARSQPHRSYSA